MLAEAEATPKRWWPQPWPAVARGTRSRARPRFPARGPAVHRIRPGWRSPACPSRSGDEGRRDAGHASLDTKPRRLERISQQRRRALLLVADLSPFPDLPGLLPGGVGPRIDRFIERSQLSQAGEQVANNVRAKVLRNIDFIGRSRGKGDVGEAVSNCWQGDSRCTHCRCGQNRCQWAPCVGLMTPRPSHLLEADAAARPPRNWCDVGSGMIDMQFRERCTLPGGEFGVE